MRVIATADGFYNGHRIRSGQEFDALDGAKGKWFVPVTAPVKPKTDVKAAEVKGAKAQKAAAPAGAASDLA